MENSIQEIDFEGMERVFGEGFHLIDGIVSNALKLKDEFNSTAHPLPERSLKYDFPAEGGFRLLPEQKQRLCFAADKVCNNIWIKRFENFSSGGFLKKQENIFNAYELVFADGRLIATQNDNTGNIFFYAARDGDALRVFPSKFVMHSGFRSKYERFFAIIGNTFGSSSSGYCVEAPAVISCADGDYKVVKAGRVKLT